MARSTLNDIMFQLEDALSALEAPDGQHAIDVLLANRTAITILRRVVRDLNQGAGDRARQALRKERRAAATVTGSVALWEDR